jgi:hypothetical protein
MQDQDDESCYRELVESGAASTTPAEQGSDDAHCSQASPEVLAREVQLADEVRSGMRLLLMFWPGVTLGVVAGAAGDGASAKA